MKGDLAMYDRFGTTDPANDSHSIRRSDLPLTRRSALLLGAAVGMGAAASLSAGRAGAGPARAGHGFWTVLLRSLAVAHA